MCTYAEGSPGEIQTTAHWNLIGHSITAPSPVLSPSSILPPPSPRCTFITERKNSLRASKKIMISFCYFVFNCVSLKLRNKISVNRECVYSMFPPQTKDGVVVRCTDVSDTSSSSSSSTKIRVPYTVIILHLLGLIGFWTLPTVLYS
jgi:hypothetical protein